jgi:hypothetical protein
MPFSRTSAIIGENCTVTIAFGGLQDGTPATFTADTYTCIARSARATTSTATVDVSALCDTVSKVQATKSSGTLELELLVDSVVGPICSLKEGYYVQVVLTLNGLTSAIKTYIGVVTGWGVNVANGEAVTETMTITLGANGVTTAWA